ncbi:MAG: SMP-30/gluconolactonase/LRE family protein, partial [Pseudomonadota bacterium]
MLHKLVDGFCFGEGPRWYEGRLWFSDVIGQQVYAMDDSGHLEAIVKLDDMPSGLGFLPDGRLLIMTMISGRLMLHDGQTLTQLAALSNLSPYPFNDMVTDTKG